MQSFNSKKNIVKKHTWCVYHVYFVLVSLLQSKYIDWKELVTLNFLATIFLCFCKIEYFLWCLIHKHVIKKITKTFYCFISQWFSCFRQFVYAWSVCCSEVCMGVFTSNLLIISFLDETVPINCIWSSCADNVILAFVRTIFRILFKSKIV